MKLQTMVTANKNNKAFTLMELMIVIVIIGILAAIGLTVFGGQAEKAKIAATKANHKTINKFISVQLMNCDLGSELILKKLVSNKVTEQADLCPKVKNWGTGNNSHDIISAFDYHFKAEGWENPHNKNTTATSTCSVDVSRKQVSGNLGLTCINRDFWGKKILIGTKVSEAGEVLINSIKLQ